MDEIHGAASDLRVSTLRMKFETLGHSQSREGASPGKKNRDLMDLFEGQTTSKMRVRFESMSNPAAEIRSFSRSHSGSLLERRVPRRFASHSSRESMSAIFRGSAEEIGERTSLKPQDFPKPGSVCQGRQQAMLIRTVIQSIINKSPLSKTAKTQIESAPASRNEQDSEITPASRSRQDSVRDSESRKDQDAPVAPASPNGPGSDIFPASGRGQDVVNTEPHFAFDVVTLRKRSREKRPSILANGSDSIFSSADPVVAQNNSTEDQSSLDFSSADATAEQNKSEESMGLPQDQCIEIFSSAAATAEQNKSEESMGLPQDQCIEIFSSADAIIEQKKSADSVIFQQQQSNPSGSDPVQCSSCIQESCEQSQVEAEVNDEPVQAQNQVTEERRPQDDQAQSPDHAPTSEDNNGERVQNEIAKAPESHYEAIDRREPKSSSDGEAPGLVQTDAVLRY